jgi:hypothetical protein
MKLLLPPLGLLLLSLPAGDEVHLSFAPEEGTVLKRVFEAKAEYHLTDMTISVDGKELEREGAVPEDSSSFTEHIAVSDKLGAIEEGRPVELVRTFDELGQEDSSSDGEHEVSNTLTSALQGRAVRFRWDGDAGRYQAETADDSELDDDVATWLAEDMDLRLVLPSKAVEPGDEWELDPKLYLAFMWPSGLLAFHAEGEEPGSGSDDFSRETIERLQGSGSAHLVEVREEEGTRVAVIHVELEIKTGSDDVMAADEEEQRPEIKVEVEIGRKLEGTILWDLEHGHVRSAELECDASRLLSQKWQLTGEDEDGEEAQHDIERAFLYEGKIHYKATIDRE